MSQILMGVDLVDVVKFKAVLLRHGRFEQEVFTDSERECALARSERWPRAGVRR